MKKITLIILFFVIPHTVYLQVQDRRYYDDIAKGLGYYYGIEYSIGRILDKYPELSKKALMAKMNFDISHKKSIERMERIIAEKFKMEKLDFKQIVIEQSKTQYDFENFSYDEAQHFLNYFTKERIRGEHVIYSEFVKILLSHNPDYISQPLKEFLDGFTELFNSKGHQKSKGLNLSIEYPKSWKSKEGKRPNILTLIENPGGNCKVAILIKDFLKEMKKGGVDLSNQEVQYIKSDDFATEFADEIFTYEYGESYVNDLMENVSDYSFYRTKVDGQPAVVIKASGDIGRGQVNTHVYTVNYIVMYKNYSITLSAMIIDVDGDLKGAKRKYAYLSERIINSLIIIDKWR